MYITPPGRGRGVVRFVDVVCRTWAVGMTFGTKAYVYQNHIVMAGRSGPEDRTAFIG